MNDMIQSTVSLIDGALLADMLRGGASALEAHKQEINDLNVFPIPDGDTGDNMLMTVQGGAMAAEKAARKDHGDLSGTAHRMASGMLLGARGNSGVILSQFFDGFAKGLAGLTAADADALGNAFREGVAKAYAAVITPAEGTILTVIREATEYACAAHAPTPLAFMEAFLDEADKSLARTPELLPVLRDAGVVDSGGAGLICIMDGMTAVLRGEEVTAVASVSSADSGEALDLDAFNEDSVLEFGYCTELLVRLMNAKCNPETFDVTVISDYLTAIGNSVVCIKNGSIVKLHVHTMTPDKVLAFCQQYGEFLTVKIENMSLQHNNTDEATPAGSTPTGNAPTASASSAAQSFVTTAAQNAATTVGGRHGDRRGYAVVTVASGAGLRQAFTDMGADYVVDGGQSMNPSAEDFMEAFDAVDAQTVLVLPNNSNIILAAKQAASLYEKSDVRVLESHTIGQGYTALSMLDTSSGDTDVIVSELTDAMEGVVTACVSACVRDAEMHGISVHAGEHIGFVGKDILASAATRADAACALADALDFTDREICLMICGEEAPADEAQRVYAHITKTHPRTEVYMIDGGQKIYSYMLILE